MAKLKMTLFFMENIIDAEIEVLENENYDLGETFCICGGFETNAIILCESMKPR